MHLMHLHTCICSSQAGRLTTTSLSSSSVREQVPDSCVQIGNMSQKIIEELQIGQQILREEVRQLRTQLDLVMQLLTRREGSQPSYQPQMYLASQALPSRVTPPQRPRKRHHQQMPLQQRTRQNFQQNHRGHNQPRTVRVFDPIPLSYSRMLQHLLQSKLVNLRNMPPSPRKLPAGYNPNAYCEFHSGGIGHGIEDCLALKYMIQDWIDQKQLTFEGEIPIMNGQPLL